MTRPDDPARRRDRHVVLAALAVILVLAWAWLLQGAGMEMSAAEMTRMAGMDTAMMAPAAWGPGYAALMLSMWWVMMAAMMLPSAAPALLLFARVSRTEPLAGTALFAAGYLVAWGGFSAAATGLQWALESARLLSPALQTTQVWLGAAILIAAGLWQLTPIKAACLRHCRSPLGFLIANWRAGRGGAVIMGLHHGAFCLGCCWFLMALLFFGGVMNLFWIAGLAAFVLVEKLLAPGLWVARAAGLGLIGWGLALPML